MIDHTNCSHPRTPAGRRACRAGKATPVAPRKPVEKPVAAWKPPVAPRVPAKRRKAVSGPYSGCVQAALHVGEGRCACGWSNPIGWQPPVAKPSKARVR